VPAERETAKVLHVQSLRLEVVSIEDCSSDIVNSFYLENKWSNCTSPPTS